LGTISTTKPGRSRKTNGLVMAVKEDLRTRWTKKILAEMAELIKLD
jgi:hypothetical protein